LPLVTAMLGLGQIADSLIDGGLVLTSRLLVRKLSTEEMRVSQYLSGDTFRFAPSSGSNSER
jgi:hypothetical protein